VLYEAVLDSSDVSSGELVNSLSHVPIFGSDWRYGLHRFLFVSLAHRVDPLYVDALRVERMLKA
jgi:hypothetical protein